MTTTTTSFEQIKAQGEVIRAFLAGQGIALNPSSALSVALENVGKAVGYWRARIAPTDLEAERLLNDLAAVDALGPVIDTIKRSGQVAGLLDRLKSMASGDPRLISKGTRSSDRDALFELICWHVCMQFADNVSFAEPDICCVYRGRYFGLACKAHYGKTGQAVKAIRKGWRQVLTSPVEYGFVMLHMTNHFPHERMYELSPEGGGIRVPASETSLGALFNDNLKHVSQPIEEGFVEHLKRNPRKLDGRFHGTMYAAHSLPYLREARVRMGGIVFQRMTRGAPEAVELFVRNVNNFWQDLSASGTSPL